MGYTNAPDEPGRPSSGARRAPRCSDARRCSARLRRDESGQSLLVVVIGMTLIVLIAAFAIDVSQWFVKHHQAQVTADSAALAAANYMGNAIAAGTATTAASSTGTTTAVTYASDNGLPIGSGNVTIDASAKTVTVIVPTTGPLTFAGLSLGSGPSISARAVASWALRDCSNAGSNCAFVFAGDNVCAGNTGVTGVISQTGTKTGVINHGVTISSSGTNPTRGGVVSASNITTNVNGNTQNWAASAAYPPTDVNGAACSGPNPASPAPYSSATKRTVSSQFPIDYRTIYTACSASTCLAGFPPYCTVDSTAASYTVSSVPPSGKTVYCDAGTGTTSDPSTWNGTISVTATGGNATYIGGIVDFAIPSTSQFAPASGNTLLAYAADCNASIPLPSTCPTGHATTTAPVINLTSNGNATLSGDFFAPAGVIDSNLGGTPAVTGFLEGWDIVYVANGTVTGQGPQVTNTDTFIADYLIQ